MADHPSTDRLVELAAGLVAREQRDELLAHLERCPSCDEAFRESLRQQELLHARLAPLPAKPRRRAWWWAGAAVAALLIVAVVGREQPAELDYWLPTDAAATPSRSPAVDPRFERALAAYDQRRLARAERLLSEPYSRELERRRLLYLASVRLGRGDVDGAAELFAALEIDQVPQPWRRRAARVRLQLDCARGEFAAAETRRASLRESGGTIGLWAVSDAPTCP